MITKEQAQPAFDAMASELAEAGYPTYIREDLRIAFDGRLGDEPTFTYAAHSCTRTFEKLIADHEMVISEVKKGLDVLNEMRKENGREPVSGGASFVAHKIWTEELKHLILLRDYFLQRLEQHKSNE